MIRDGVDLFQKQFNFKSLSTVAPNVSWTDDAENIWLSCGIRYVQGGLIQYLDGKIKRRQRIHYLGEKSRHNVLYLTRNCNFEPSRFPHHDAWKACLRDIARAFVFRKPAIISSHRVNYIGAIDQDNRTKGLFQLRKLLFAVRQRWPDIYFLSSPELGYMVENNIRRVEDLEPMKAGIFPPVSALSYMQK